MVCRMIKYCEAKGDMSWKHKYWMAERKTASMNLKVLKNIQR